MLLYKAALTHILYIKCHSEVVGDTLDLEWDQYTRANKAHTSCGMYP